MSNTTSFSPFEREVQAIMSAPSGVPDASTEFILQLKDRLHQQALQNSTRQSTRHPRPFVLRRGWVAAIVILFVLMVTILAIGPQRVLAAVRSLFGYIPGLGIVQEDSSLRILAESITTERDGITLQVTEGAGDNLHTILIYQVDGLSVAAANSQGENAIIGGVAILVLPDGSILTQTGGEGKNWGTGYQMRLIFPALPKDVNEVSLVIERLETMPAGVAPENWSIPLKFEPAPSNIEMLPVYELSSPTEMSTNQEAVTTPTDSNHDEMPYGIQLILDRVVETETGFSLQGKIDWPGQPYSLASFTWLDGSVTLTDGLGNTIPFEEVQPDYSLETVSTTSSLWALETNSKSYPGPWTLSVNSMQVNQAVSDPLAIFNIDFGKTSQLGQTWEIDQSVQVVGLSIEAISAILRQDSTNGDVVLDVLLKNDPAINHVGLDDFQKQSQENQTTALGSGPGSAGLQELEAGQQITSIAYPEIPSGEHSLSVTAISYNVTANWQVSWTPPEASTEIVETASPDSVCLTDETWQQLLSQPGTLPEGLNGRLLMEEYTGYLMPLLSLVNIDGSDQKELLFGGWGALAPDGSTVAYIESDGPALMLLDTTTMQSRQLPGSVTDDYHAEWSQDGQWLAFVRSNDGIYISRSDGSGLRQVVDASKIRFLAGWLPDNRLVITSLEMEGSQVQILDVETGVTEEMFVIENAKGGFVKLSPDGKRVAFAEQLFGVPVYGIYTANLDGSNKHLVSSLNSSVAAGAWSPDSQWLALSVKVQGSTNTTYETVILQPDTSKIILLPQLSGKIISWAAMP